MGKAKQRGAAANTSQRNAVEAQQDPVEALAEAIKWHVAVSRHDRTPRDAIRDLVRCFHHVMGAACETPCDRAEPSSLAQYGAEELEMEITLVPMIAAYMEAVKQRPVFHDVLSEVASTFTGADARGLERYVFSTVSAEAAVNEISEHRDELQEMLDDLTDDDEVRVVAACCGSGSLLLAQLRGIDRTVPGLLPWIDVCASEQDPDLRRATGMQVMASCSVHKRLIKSMKLWGAAPGEPVILFERREQEEVSHD